MSVPEHEAGLPPTVVVIPALNEARGIGAVIDAFTGPGNDFIIDIIVADGGSIDGTQAVVAEAARRDARVRLLPNPKRLQSAGVNLATQEADPRAEVILRADSHAEYPADFAVRVVSALVTNDADSVVARMFSVGRGSFQRAVAAVSNSKAGSGGSRHRIGGQSGFVDHGHHAAFRRQLFRELGGYDETFIANEDAEFDARIRAAGGRIWFEAGPEITYFPRATPAALARQYWRYGYGRARTFRKHGERLQPRQMLPPVILVAVLGGLLLAPLTPWALLIPGAYLLLGLAVGALLAWQLSDLAALAAPVALAAMHLSWGAGFLRGLLSREKFTGPARPTLEFSATPRSE